MHGHGPTHRHVVPRNVELANRLVKRRPPGDKPDTPLHHFVETLTIETDDEREADRRMEGINFDLVEANRRLHAQFQANAARQEEVSACQPYFQARVAFNRPKPTRTIPLPAAPAINPTPAPIAVAKENVICQQAELETLLEALEIRGFKFGLTRPNTAEELEKLIAARRKWATMSPSPLEVIEQVVNGTFAFPEPELEEPIPEPTLIDEPTIELASEPIVEIMVTEEVIVVEAEPEEVVEATKPEAIVVDWTKFQTGREVRRVVQGLEVLRIVNFGLVKPTTAMELKKALSRLLGPEWTITLAAKPEAARVFVN